MTTLKASIAFDAYIDSIKEATLVFMKTGPSRAKWGIEWYPFNRIHLQLGADGGDRVVHGISRGDAVTFMFYTGKTRDEVLFDGYSIKWHEICVLAPGAHFTFAAKTPTRWFSLTIPTELVDAPECLREHGVSFGSRNVAITLAEGAARKLMAAAAGARNGARNSADIGAIDGPAVEAALRAALNEALTARETKLRLPDRHQSALELKVSQALEYIRSKQSGNIHIGEIAEAAGVSSRALQRCFQTYLRMAPKEYLKFRQLNLVRRGLRLDPSPGSSNNHVTRILAHYGVTEFGRFAVEYRRLFHESPSGTFARRASIAKIT